MVTCARGRSKSASSFSASRTLVTLSRIKIRFREVSTISFCKSSTPRMLVATSCSSWTLIASGNGITTAAVRSKSLRFCVLSLATKIRRGLTGNQEGIGGGFQAAQCVAIVGIGQLEAERARRLIIGIEQHFQVQRGGHLFPQGLGVALEVIIVPARLGLQLSRRQRLSRLFQVRVGDGSKQSAIDLVAREHRAPSAGWDPSGWRPAVAPGRATNSRCCWDRPPRLPHKEDKP